MSGTRSSNLLRKISVVLVICCCCLPAEGEYGVGIGNPLEYPLGIAVDDSGNAYVTGSVSDNAFKITPDGFITEIIDSTDVVDFQDFAGLASEWQEVDCREPDWCDRADIDFSGDVGFSDMRILTEIG